MNPQHCQCDPKKKRIANKLDWQLGMVGGGGALSRRSGPAHRKLHLVPRAAHQMSAEGRRSSVPVHTPPEHPPLFCGLDAPGGGAGRPESSGDASRYVSSAFTRALGLLGVTHDRPAESGSRECGLETGLWISRQSDKRVWPRFRIQARTQIADSGPGGTVFIENSNVWLVCVHQGRVVS